MKTKTIALLLAILSVALCLTVNPAFSITKEAEDSWVSKAQAQLLTETCRLGVGVINGKIYAIGGYNESWQLLDTNELYDPSSDTWITLAKMPTPRAHFGTAVYQGKIYVIGGSDPSNHEVLATNEQYTPIGYGNLSESATEEPIPFPATAIVVAVSGAAAIISTGLIIYFRKRHVNERTTKRVND